jgi:hypothetical protein
LRVDEERFRLYVPIYVTIPMKAFKKKDLRPRVKQIKLEKGQCEE